MMADELTDETARTLRKAWFDYLDALEPLRKPLHAYGMRLTGNVWDAEDLVQETLLKGFAMMARGDLHGPRSPVANARAYLFRSATHLWIDGERKKARESTGAAEPVPAMASVEPEAVREAGERLFAAASPQARAAVVLKDVFDFSLDEIADLLRTTAGAVKAALHRGRAGLRAPEPAERASPPRALIDRFVDAYNSHDLPRLLAVMTDAVSIEVPGVGGGRGMGPDDGWALWVAENPVRAQAGRVDGEDVVAVLFAGPQGEAMCEVLRLEGDERQVSRIVDYCFCPETMAHAAMVLGLKPMAMGYHQDPDTLVRMIATTTRPWGSAGIFTPPPPAPR
jgi:RNA polymerase sigma-70 factor (ECF subfamily)